MPKQNNKVSLFYIKKVEKRSSLPRNSVGHFFDGIVTVRHVEELALAPIFQNIIKLYGTRFINK